MSEEVSDDGFLGRRLRLLQPKRGHRFGGDAALLVAAARSVMKDGDAVADFGAGVGAVGLGLALLGAGRVVLVEIDPALAAISAQNADRNGLRERTETVVCDVAALCRPGAPADVAPDRFDLVAANPPFDDPGRFRPSSDSGRALAHLGDDVLFADWASAAARALKPGGAFVAIHRPEALAGILAALDGAFGDVRLKPVHARAGAPAGRLLVSARKGGRGPLEIRSALVMHAGDGGFTAEADAAQRGEAALDLA